MSEITSHKVGTSRAGEGTRIWLEGARLIAVGFTHKTPVKRKWKEGKLILKTITAKEFEALGRAERTTVAGSKERPIIDITGAAVAETFPSGKVAVSWSEGRIEIKGVE